MKRKQPTELSKTNLYECLAIRKYELERIIAEKKTALERAPEGLLRVSKSSQGSCFQYYVRGRGEPNGKYMRKRDEALARKLAQKEYDIKFIERAETELEQIDKFLAKCPEDNIINLYNRIPEGKRILTVPTFLPDEQYVSRWLAIPYEGKSTSRLNTEYYTDNGEHVRSKSEVLIANMLKQMNVPYKYECPLELYDGLTFYPDFTAMNVRTREIKYWEHLGMMDDPDYRVSALRKINEYKASGYYPGTEMIYTHETLEEPLGTNDIRDMIRKYLL